MEAFIQLLGELVKKIQLGRLLVTLLFAVALVRPLITKVRWAKEATEWTGVLDFGIWGQLGLSFLLAYSAGTLIEQGLKWRQARKAKKEGEKMAAAAERAREAELSDLAAALDEHERIAIKAFVDNGCSTLRGRWFGLNAVGLGIDPRQLDRALDRLAARRYLSESNQAFIDDTFYHLRDDLFSRLSEHPEMLGSSAPPRKVIPV